MLTRVFFEFISVALVTNLLYFWLVRYRDEELELGEVVNFQIPVKLDAGRRWLEAGQTLVSAPTRSTHVLVVERQQPQRFFKW